MCADTGVYTCICDVCVQIRVCIHVYVMCVQADTGVYTCICDVCVQIRVCIHVYVMCVCRYGCVYMYM